MKIDPKETPSSTIFLNSFNSLNTNKKIKNHLLIKNFNPSKYTKINSVNIFALSVYKKYKKTSSNIFNKKINYAPVKVFTPYVM